MKLWKWTKEVIRSDDGHRIGELWKINYRNLVGTVLELQAIENPFKHNKDHEGYMYDIMMSVCLGGDHDTCKEDEYEFMTFDDFMLRVKWASESKREYLTIGWLRHLLYKLGVSRKFIVTYMRNWEMTKRQLYVKFILRARGEEE